MFVQEHIQWSFGSHLKPQKRASSNKDTWSGFPQKANPHVAPFTNPSLRFASQGAGGKPPSCLFTTQSNTKASPFPSLRVHSKHEGTNMKCKPNCGPGGTLSKTRLASCSGGILAGSTGENWRAAPARCCTRQDPPARDTQRDLGILGGIHWRATLGYSAGSAGQQLWRDTARDPLASSSGGIFGGIHWRAALAGYSVASCSGGILGGGVV